MSVVLQGAGGPARISLQVARESYERCLRAPDFFALPYQQLLASAPVIPAMLDAVRRCDPECSDEVEDAWREAVRPGLESMQSRYDG